ncbi:MAG: hypothetical protein CSYNP_01648 [Syntrophus sp. SKADARSKE-3]|nr:hypothetical protein [Syntrophus sp. SKADARSKE-3]
MNSLAIKNRLNSLRRPVALGCAVIFTLMSLRLIWVATTHGGDRKLTFVFVIALLVLAFGLVRRFRWAMRLTALLLLFSALLLPVGVFNPFTAGDYMTAGKVPPSIAMTLLWMIPLEVLLLITAYVLDQKKE